MMEGRVVVWSAEGKGRSYYGRAYSSSDIAMISLASAFAGAALTKGLNCLFAKLRNGEEEKQEEGGNRRPR